MQIAEERSAAEAKLEEAKANEEMQGAQLEQM